MNAHLFLINIPCSCSGGEVKDWIESFGIETQSIRIVRDMVAGVSPSFGYVELQDNAATDEAIAVLNGKKIRNHTVITKQAPHRPVSTFFRDRQIA